MDPTMTHNIDTAQRDSDASHWRAAKSIADVQMLMAGYIRGELHSSPWHSGPLDPESIPHRRTLEDMNRAGLITTGSQPGTSPRQRSFVEGFAPTDGEILDVIIEPMRSLGYDVTTDWATPDLVEPHTVPATRTALGRVTTHLAARKLIPVTFEMNEELVNWTVFRLLDTTVTPIQIIDLEWGRNTLFGDLNRLLVTNAMRGAVWTEDPS